MVYLQKHYFDQINLIIINKEVANKTKLCNYKCHQNKKKSKHEAD